jgi:L-prolyl-PCP dehydrogenase
MDFSYTNEQRALRDQIVKFARDVLSAGAGERDKAQSFPRELWQKCGEFGLPGLLVSEEFGGLGLDAVSCAVALEALGYGCRDGGLVFSLCAHLLSCVVPIWKHGSMEQKQKYLPGLCDGTLVGGNATTEPGSGSDAFAMRTRAEKCDGGFKLNGTKMFVSNGPVADVLLVYAVTDAAKGYHGGVTGFLVDTKTAGMASKSKIEKMGLRSSPLGELVFDDVFVPANAVLGGVGGGSPIFTESMDWERTLLFAAHVGTMERLVEQAVAHARMRSQFGQQIGKFQGVAHRIADMKVRLEAARLLVYRAAWRLERSKTAALDAALCKLFVSEAFVETAMDAVQVYGGYGYTTEYEVERILRDAMGSRLYSGTSEMQRNIVGRWLGL